MKQVLPVVLLVCVFAACSGDGSEALLRVDARGVQALRSALDLATGRLTINCTDGRRFDVPVALDAIEPPGQELTVAVPACGDARIEFQILSGVGVPELRGANDAVLVPGFVDVEIPLGYVGQLSLSLATDSLVESCVAVVERTSPDRVLVESALTLTRTEVTSLIVPIGSYDVTCDGRIAQTLVSPGLNVDVALIDPVPGPRLISTTLQPSYPPTTARIDVTFTFSAPVTGVDASSVSLDNDGTIQAVSGSGSSYTVTFNGLNIGTDYIVTLSASIVDSEGLPLVGAPLRLPFRIRANEYFVSTAGDDSVNSGTDPTSPWRNIAFAVASASTPARIYVAAGTYDEQVFLASDVTIEGGWSADFVTRDLATNESRVRASNQTVFFGSVGNAVVDGLTIEATQPQQVVVMQNADATLRNCIVTGAGGTFPTGYGVFIEGLGLPSLVNNVIAVSAGSSSTYAVFVQNGGSARVIHNTIDAGDRGIVSGVYLDSAAGDVSIVNNLFVGGTTVNTRVGITGEAPPTALVNNAFSAEHDDAYRNAAGTGLPIGAAGDFGFTAPHRFSGNVLVAATAALVSGGDYRSTPDSSLQIGIDSAPADCGFTDTSAYPCFGPTTDRLGQARAVPTTVGAYASGAGAL